MSTDDTSALTPPPDACGPCHAASLPPVWRAAMAPRGDLLPVRVLWVSGWPNARGDTGTAGANRIHVGPSLRVALSRGVDTALPSVRSPCPTGLRGTP